jgi:WD40 repeat protein
MTHLVSGCVKVWDTRQHDAPVATIEPSDKDQSRDCWAVCFGNTYNDEERCVAAGYDNGDVKLFDLRAMALRWETNVGNGICSVEFDRRDIMMNKLVTAGLEASFLVFDLRTFHPTKGYSSLHEQVKI